MSPDVVISTHYIALTLDPSYLKHHKSWRSPLSPSPPKTQKLLLSSSVKPPVSILSPGLAVVVGEISLHLLLAISNSQISCNLVVEDPPNEIKLELVLMSWL